MTFRSLATLLGGTPADTADTPGQPAGTRFVGFGEGVTSAITNRPNHALAENTDDLNTRMAIWETDGIDASYDLGAAAVPGGGRLVTKDAGAIETVSALTTEYADDIANAHFRASAVGDTSPAGGGYDFQGGADPEEVLLGAGWAGFLDRRRIGIRPAGFESFFSQSESVNLNPGGALASTVRLVTGGRFFFSIAAGPVPPAGNYTNLNLGVDLIEISGSGSSDGVYIIEALGTLATDVQLRSLSGATPTFATPNEAATVTVYRVKFGSIGSSEGGSARTELRNNLMVASQLSPSALDVLASGDEGTLSEAFRTLWRGADGTLVPGGRFDRFGRLRFDVTSDELASSFSLGTDYGRALGGAFASRVERDGAGGSLAEIGHYVYSDDDIVKGRFDFMSMTPLDIGGVTGLDLSVPFDFVAGSPTLGQIDFSPVLGSGWADHLVPYGTVVELVTGDSPSRGFYLIDSVGGGVDAIFLLNLDHTVPAHFPTSGAGTLRFYTASRLGRGATTTGLAGMTPLAGSNSTMTPYNVMMGGSETDASAITLMGPANAEVGDDRALLRAFTVDNAAFAGPIEIFSVLPEDRAGGPQFGQAKCLNLLALKQIALSGAATEVVYTTDIGTPTLKSRTLNIDLSTGKEGTFSAALPWVYLGSAWEAKELGSDLYFAIDLPEGSELITVEAIVTPAVARPIAGDRVNIKVAKLVSDWAATPTAGYSFDASTPDDATANIQVISHTVSVAASFNVTANATTRWHVVVGSGTTSTVTDRVHAIRFIFSDPGPRNF